MIPLNEYPKEELESLLYDLERIEGLTNSSGWHSNKRHKWITRIRESISDQEFKEKELPFKTE